MKPIQISPSMLASDFSNLQAELNKCARSGAHMIHLDVMDGHFVPNITFGPPIIARLKQVCTVPFDVHLMISDPLRYVESFVQAGADILVFHLEADSDTQATLNQLHSLGCKAGIAIKPNTEVELVYPYLSQLSMVLVMTVEPGFGGQSFLADMMPKVRALRAYCDQQNLQLDIQVDGGITADTIGIASQNGANVFVAGSAIFNATDPQATINTLIKVATDNAICC